MKSQLLRLFFRETLNVCHFENRTESGQVDECGQGTHAKLSHKLANHSSKAMR